MEIEVTSCRNCKFCIENDMSNTYRCNIDVTNKNIYINSMYRPITPSWCPLKKEDCIIKFKKDANKI
jgi:hypothetical protein